MRWISRLAVLVVLSVLSAGLAISGAQAAGLIANPPSIDFADTQTGETSPQGFSSIQNATGASVTITTTNLSGPNASEFEIFFNGCINRTLAPNDQCFMQLTFKPQTAGIKTASLDLAATEGNSMSVSLGGEGFAPDMAVSPPSLNFGSVQVGERSMQQFAQVFNTGVGPIHPTATLGGANPSQYSTTFGNSCSGQLVSPGGSCFVNLEGRPTSAGSKPAVVNVTDPDIPTEIVALSLIGTLPSFSVSPTSISFGQVQVGQTTTSFEFVSVFNTGNGPITPQVTLTG